MDELQILHEDDDLIVVDKPTGLATTAPNQGASLMQSLSARYPQHKSLHATSRLDRPVTGVVIVARTKAANQSLLQARRRGAYSRWYLAIVETGSADGHTALSKASGCWDWAISIDPAQRKLRTIKKGAGRRDARTFYEVLFREPSAALLQLSPVTGRTHQLRVHAAAAGLPIVGDVAYGGLPRIGMPDGRVVPARRVMLHCAQVAIGQPDEPRFRCFRAPVPSDFRECWRQLGGEQDLSALSFSR